MLYREKLRVGQYSKKISQFSDLIVFKNIIIKIPFYFQHRLMHDPMNVLEPADSVPMSVPIQMPRSDSPHFRSGRAWVRAPMPPIEEEYPASWASQEVDPMEHEYIPMDQLQGHFGDVNSPSTVDQELVSILFYPFFRSLFEISNI